jgi:hypothetical protein
MADITDITSGIIDGAGYFDKFMTVLNLHIDREFQKGSIQAPDFATVYLGALQLALTQAVQYVATVQQVQASIDKTASEVSLLDQKTLTEQAQILDTVNGNVVAGAVGVQKALQQAQADGFLRDAEQKAVKILMDTWQVSKSVTGDAIDTPDGARNDDLEDVIIKLREGIGISASIYKFRADAGPDQIQVPVNSTVLLTGVGSRSPEDATPPESISTYSWTQINGAAVTVTGANTATPTFTATATPDIYEFKLTITGTLGSTDFDTVKITTV